jgi:hypothetical protein
MNYKNIITDKAQSKVFVNYGQKNENRRIGILETDNHLNSMYERFLKSQAIWEKYLKNFKMENKYSNILLKNDNFKGVLREVIFYDFEGINDIIIEIFIESKVLSKNIFKPYIYEKSNSIQKDYFFIKITYIGIG